MVHKHFRPADIRHGGGAAKQISIEYENFVKNSTSLKKKDKRKVITPKTRILMLTNPSNPTGAVMQKDTLSKIAAILRTLKNNVFFLSF